MAATDTIYARVKPKQKSDLIKEVKERKIVNSRESISSTLDMILRERYRLGHASKTEFVIKSRRKRA